MHSSYTHYQVAPINAKVQACQRVYLPYYLTVTIVKKTEEEEEEEQRRHNRGDKSAIDLINFVSHHRTYGSRTCLPVGKYGDS
ncbi:MAG: hypothetical protein MUF45_14595 [Spirosomaceae bacterium]|jgi:hypothetical protein|nr:hypothetical protein [Spirosomataceae bacterium]